jgi:hypothetical protein
MNRGAAVEPCTDLKTRQEAPVVKGHLAMNTPDRVAAGVGGRASN